VIRRRDGDCVVVEQHHAADHALFEELPGVVDLFGRELILLVVLVVHEDVLVALLVEILGVDLFDVGHFERFAAALNGAIQDRAPEQVPQLALVERLTFARLDEVALDHNVRVAVDLDLQALAKITRVVGSHVFHPLRLNAYGTYLGLIQGSNARRPEAHSDCILKSRTKSVNERRSTTPTDQAPDFRLDDSLGKDAITDPVELCRELDLPKSIAQEAFAAAEDFGLLVPRSLLARMRSGDVEDPVLRQFLPRPEETVLRDGYLMNPLQEKACSTGSGMLQKYTGRQLVLTVGTCTAHCRFCFRRHAEKNGLSAAYPLFGKRWTSFFDQLKRNPSVHEVILSGGDPFTLDDLSLERIVQGLASIPHVRRVRFHTRAPIAVPRRVTDTLLDAITRTPLRTVVVFHVNHPNEIDDDVIAMFERCREADLTLLCQSVLLRGVNDDADTLSSLYEKLIDYGVTPYYLHCLDRVQGAAHFEVPESEARELVRLLRLHLPGYAVPRLVREIPGEKSKTILE
jgi:L-lysine 2,3-aminomutase